MEIGMMAEGVSSIEDDLAMALADDEDPHGLLDALFDGEQTTGCKRIK
jgi:hypothetical protein